MKRTAMGLIAGLMLGAPALAQDTSPPPPGPEQESPESTPRELTARVLGAGSGYLYVASEEGVAIPVRVTHRTRISGRRIPREQAIPTYLRQQLEPGQPVRVRFDVGTLEDGTPQNIARSIDPS